VLTTCSHAAAGLGSLQHWFSGEPGADGWQSSASLFQAAVFDAVIAQQDRNMTNFSYEPDSDTLGLFDHSFAFALPGHPRTAAAIVEAARARDPRLPRELVLALRHFLESEESEMLGEILERERYERVLERARRMLDTGELLEPTES